MNFLNEFCFKYKKLDSWHYLEELVKLVIIDRKMSFLPLAIDGGKRGQK